MGRVRAGPWSPSWRTALAATEAPVGEETLLPEERDLIEGSTAERTAEFATGRHCARLALASLDPSLSRVPLLRDHRGAPTWPPGVVGSVTHCAGWTGAVVARSRGSRLGRGVAAIGLDAEPIAPLPAGVLEVVASGDEREVLARLDFKEPGIPWDTLLFSAKEATYKAWYPLTGIVLGHAAVRVELSPTGTFTGGAAAHDSAGREVRQRVRGRWVLGPRVMVTLCVAG
jgi:4'-phosphopantetheinyl transferase EntD